MRQPMLSADPGGPPGFSGHGGPPGFGGHGVSLLAGWLPLALQILAALVLLAAIGRREKRWLVRGLPALAVISGVTALLFQRYLSANGLAGDPAPLGLLVWVGLTAAAALLVVLGWRGAGWPRRGLSVLAVPLSLLCVGIVLNSWVGYFTTIPEAWSQFTAGPLPDEVSDAQLSALVATGTAPRTGQLVGLTIPATDSHFAHREEYVYLPPAWFTADHPTPPVLMMVSGEFNTPADWVRVGNAVQTADGFAAGHQGLAPVLVFVDSGGSFNNDTECVDGPRGNVADYLTQDVPSYLESRFHVATSPTRWGVVGWSAGGTCAVDLAVMHPELFDTFEDIAGDLGPNVGDQATTIANLYGGNAAAWAAYDPMTVLAAHARYPDTAGWFDNSSTTGPGGRPGGRRHPGDRSPPAGRWWTGDSGDFGDFGDRWGGTAGLGGRPDGNDRPGAQTAAATQLCAAATAKGIACALHTQDGRHSWQFASTAFSDALPWLSARLGILSPGGPPANPAGPSLASTR